MQKRDEQKDRTYSRRDFLKQTSMVPVGLALANAGIYELVDTFARPPLYATAAPTPLTPEQYILQNPQIIMDDGSGTSSPTGSIAVTVPPLHHQIVTAKLTVPRDARTLKEAQVYLERILQSLEQHYAPSHAGLAITVAWSLPYFSQFVPMLRGSSPYFASGTRYPDYLPLDLPSSQTAGKAVRAVQDAVVFPSDQPPAHFSRVLLEENDVAIIFRSDSLASIAAGTNALFGHENNQGGALFSVTSVRRGFAGGGFYGGQSLAYQMANAAGVPGAYAIPQNAELFLGFTSTGQASLATGRVTNMESLPGQTDQWPDGYFQHATAMHLSHVYEDLSTWYEGHGSQSFSQLPERLRGMFHPGLIASAQTRTILQGPAQVESQQDVFNDLATYGAVGHGATLQPVTRLQQAATDNYGTSYPAGTTIIQRSDFNTLDNPFAYTSNPHTDHYSDKAAAGVHFVFFSPTSDLFHRTRLAMDGQYSDGSRVALSPRSFHMGINSVLFTSHRQNFLVPSRAHRSFPLVEYLV